METEQTIYDTPNGPALGRVLIREHDVDSYTNSLMADTEFHTRFWDATLEVTKVAIRISTSIYQKLERFESGKWCLDKAEYRRLLDSYALDMPEIWVTDEFDWMLRLAISPTGSWSMPSMRECLKFYSLFDRYFSLAGSMDLVAARQLAMSAASVVGSDVACYDFALGETTTTPLDWDEVSLLSTEELPVLYLSREVYESMVYKSDCWRSFMASTAKKVAIVG